MRAAGSENGRITNGPFSHQVQKFHTLGLDKWFTEDQLIVSAGVGVAKPGCADFPHGRRKMGNEAGEYFYDRGFSGE